MAYNFCCDSYHVPNLIYIYYTIVIRVNYVTCAISWGRCSLIGLLVVMSVVVLLVLLLISFPVDGAGGGGVPCPLVLCSLLLLSVLDHLRLV